MQLTPNQILHLKELCTVLESGKYKKAVGSLMKIDPQGFAAYCCLGVGCVVSGLPWQCDHDVPPVPVREYFGFEHSCGFDLTINGVTGTMANHNDGVKTNVPQTINIPQVSHPEIAKAIRQQILGEPV